MLRFKSIQLTFIDQVLGSIPKPLPGDISGANTRLRFKSIQLTFVDQVLGSIPKPLPGDILEQILGFASNPSS